MILRYLVAVLFLLVACDSLKESGTELNDDINNDNPESEVVGLERINLPDGFEISVFADVENARSLALSPSGIVYVGNRTGNKVYAVKDTDGDGKADEKYTIAEGLNSPNGVAFKDGDLYVAEISRILKFEGIESMLNNPGDYKVVYDDYPTEGHHGWKYIAFGPDGKLYVPVGAPCNICKSEDPIYASITRINTDGSDLEIVAEGIRNTVGFDWHPETKELWFTDNGRDMMGDDIPPCELNRLAQNGQHFGYPYCHGGDIADPEFGSERHCNEFKKPAWKFAAHTAPLGMKFYTGGMFPDSYKGDVIVAQHGSWNRSSKIGYRLMRVKFNGSGVEGAEVFADGWLNERAQEAWGRPVDVLQMTDGSLLVSDDKAGKIYRIIYEK
ncbi:sorbosone dehydrogenase family protein [Fulvivirga sp. 29W222]|uniref:Sorbosone dehydrogenase family protein n=1 Tax=Fulvivirga marina TaxID=2494733 RepID=A0A937KGQ2_9BACT|nr:sorbosone dehydrogenase family protein [Fulvivirga marina]MBL6449418.1 sorbosone dehydrogenase family protein [Fulvivirga marina]